MKPEKWEQRVREMAGLRTSKEVEKVSAELHLQPRQKELLKYYTQPDSPTFGILRTSQKAAGYTNTPTIANKLRHDADFWLTQAMRRISLLEQAEQNLGMFLSPQYKANDSIKADITKFVARTLGKEHYSPTVEVNNAQTWRVELVRYSKDEEHAPTP